MRMRIASFRLKKEKQNDHWVSIGRDFRNASKWEGLAYFLSYIFFGLYGTSEQYLSRTLFGQLDVE